MGLFDERRAACIVLVLNFVSAAFGAEILFADGKSQPERLIIRPAGALIVGSASTPSAYKVRYKLPSVLPVVRYSWSMPR